MDERITICNNIICLHNALSSMQLQYETLFPPGPGQAKGDD